jgi:zinc transporter ZupT
LKNGALYIFLGLMWLLIVAVTGARKIPSTYIYAVIGGGLVIYGVVQIFLTLTIGKVIAIIIFIAVAAAAALLIYAWLHRDQFEAELSDDDVPEQSAEDRYLRQYNKETYGDRSSDDETPIL